MNAPSRSPVLRGSILAFLAAVYPERVEELSIAGIKFEYYKYQDVLKALEYLVDRKYVERTCERHPAKLHETVRFYRASPPGIDLVDGTATDAGVRVEEDL